MYRTTSQCTALQCAHARRLARAHNTQTLHDVALIHGRKDTLH